MTTRRDVPDFQEAASGLSVSWTVLLGVAAHAERETSGMCVMGRRREEGEVGTVGHSPFTPEELVLSFSTCINSYYCQPLLITDY